MAYFDSLYMQMHIKHLIPLKLYPTEFFLVSLPNAYIKPS